EVPEVFAATTRRSRPPTCGTTRLALVHCLVYSRVCEVGQRARGQDALLEAPGAGGEGPPGAHLAGRVAGRPPRAALAAAARTCVRRRSWHVRRAGGLRRAATRRRGGLVRRSRPLKILIDTHCWLWLCAARSASPTARSRASETRAPTGCCPRRASGRW